MTPVEFDYADETVVTVNPFRRVVVGNTVHLPVPNRFAVPSGGIVTVELVPTNADFCYKIIESRTQGGITRYVAVPNSETPVPAAHLQIIDKDTFLPDYEATTAWYAALAATNAAVASLQSAVQSIENGGAGTRVVSITTPSTVWDVEHNLGYKPGGIRVVLDDGTVYHPVITYIDNNTTRLEFHTSLTGTVYFS